VRGMLVCLTLALIAAHPIAAQQVSWPIAPLPSPTAPIAQDWPFPSERAFANAMDEVMLTPPCSDQERSAKSRQLTQRVDRYVVRFEARFGRKPQNDLEGSITYYDSPDCDVVLFDRHSRRASRELRNAERALKRAASQTALPVRPVNP
jgi:hypothetical protein